MHINNSYKYLPSTYELWLNLQDIADIFVFENLLLQSKAFFFRCKGLSSISNDSKQGIFWVLS